MRVAIGAGFGLVSLLVAMYIIMHMAASYLPAVSQSSAVARNEAQQWSGRDTEGKPVQQTYDLFADISKDTGKLRDLRVTRLDPGSPMATKYGLQVGDMIVAAAGEGGMRTDMISADEQTGRDTVLEAYQYNGPLYVVRNNQVLQLPGGQVANVQGLIVAQGLQSTPPPQSATAAPQQPAAAQPHPVQDPPVNHDENGTMDQINGRLRTVPGM